MCHARSHTKTTLPAVCLRRLRSADSWGKASGNGLCVRRLLRAEDVHAKLGAKSLQLDRYRAQNWQYRKGDMPASTSIRETVREA